MLFHTLDVILQTFVFIVNFLREQSIEMSLLVKILLDGQANTVWALSVSTVNNRLSPSVIPTLGGIRFSPPLPHSFQLVRTVHRGLASPASFSSSRAPGAGRRQRRSDHLPFLRPKSGGALLT